MIWNRSASPRVPNGYGTAVSVALDRRRTASVIAMTSGTAMFFTLLFSASALYPEAPALGVGGFIAGAAGTLALARSYWASSTRKVRERIGAAMETIGETLIEAEAQSPAFRPVEESSGAADPDAARS